MVPRWWRAVVLLAMTAFLVAFCALVLDLRSSSRQLSGLSPQAWVDLDERPPVLSPTGTPVTDGRSRLRVAVAPVISPEKSLETYRGLVEYLARALGREALFLPGRSYAQVNELVRNEKCDLAFVCTYAFVRGERDFGMQLLVAPQVEGSITYRSYVVVPRGSQVRSLLDLEKRSFASTDLMSTSGWLYPATWLAARGRDPERFFSRHLVTGGHDRAITAVALGLVDGAAVDSLVYHHMLREDPKLVARVRVIDESPPFGMPPLVVPGGIDPELRRSLERELLGMDRTPAGRAVLDSLNIDRFVVPGSGLYDSVRVMVDQWEGR